MILDDHDSVSVISMQVLAKDGEDAKSEYDWCTLSSLEDVDVEAFCQNLCDKLYPNFMRIRLKWYVSSVDGKGSHV